MAEKPILIFPNPRSIERTKKTTGFGSPDYRYPDVSRQKDRLTPQFDRMRQSLISDSSAGLEPETVLVLEVVGEIEDFARAARAIQGLEWLAEIDADAITPDEDFYVPPRIGKRLLYSEIEDINSRQSSELWKLLEEHEYIDATGFRTSKPLESFAALIPPEFDAEKQRIMDVLEEASVPTKSLSCRLFMSMSNQGAIDELLRLWQQWDSNRRLPRGYQKWSEIFSYLRDIRRWDVSDRLRETGVIEYWRTNLSFYQSQNIAVPFEVELWYRGDNPKRDDAIEHVRRLVAAEEGRVIKSCTIDEIRFCALKAELPASKIQGVLESHYVDLFRSNDVMFFRPTGQCAVQIMPDGEPGSFTSGTTTGNPVVALFDGVPFTNHALLDGRIRFDDPDNYSSRYQATDRRHGTAMASLICHGELDSQEEPLHRPIYVRPIMAPNRNGLNRIEHIPEDEFFEDLIERAVRRLFEGTGGSEPVAPSVRIVNLSVCDPAKVFYHRMSSMARLLDWLSYKYGLLFCVSAGNILDDLDIGLSESEFLALPAAEQTKRSIGIIHTNSRNYRIISPAESVNAITAGALHKDRSNGSATGNRIDLLHDSNLPSPISPYGFGYRSSIKPDMYIPAGRQFYHFVNGNSAQINRSILPPGQRVATAPNTGGDTTRTTYTCGTSNAAALASRSSALIWESIEELAQQLEVSIPRDNIAPIIKTLLVHGTSWGKSQESLNLCTNGSLDRKSLTRYLGYGVPDIGRVLECIDQRVTAFGYGRIGKDERHEFRLPLPPCLNGINDSRRLTITLAWLSPINVMNRNYRKANLSFEPSKIGIADDRIEADWQKVRKGTVQHEVFVGHRVASFEEGDALLIPVECREDASTLDESVCYGLAVTLEVKEDVDLPIYEQVRARIGVPVPIQERE
ncbi:MAG: S8 family peptidase [candidate division Zixibacteria bacterium]|jgi:hypothetical protein|nr:S8 family peptidase [candidate division Zixibacteria bacterium]